MKNVLQFLGCLVAGAIFWMFMAIDRSENIHISHGAFGCAINCMDGRVQNVVENYIKQKYKIDYVDEITEPGPNKILAENADLSIISNIKKRVDISINRHHAPVIAIVGHEECAGNPVGKQEQIEHLKKARKTVESFGFKSDIILLWVESGWDKVEEIR